MLEKALMYMLNILVKVADGGHSHLCDTRLKHPVIFQRSAHIKIL